MREFSIVAGGLSISGATTLVFVRAPAAPAVNLKFLRWWIGYSPNATSGQQRVQLALNSGLVTGTAATPVKLKEHDAVSAITGSTTPGAGNCNVNASAETTRTVQHEDAFNVLNGWLYVPTPAETRIQPASAASGLTMYLPVNPTTTTSWSWGVTFREV